MQFLTTLLALAATASATLPANKPCGNNIECAAECYQGAYDVSIVNHEASFVCSQSEPTQLPYVVLSCDGTAAAPYQVKKMCNAYGGTMCEGLCAMPSKEHYDFAEWSGPPDDGFAEDEFQEDSFREHIWEEIKERAEEFVDGLVDKGAVLKDEFHAKREQVKDGFLEKTEHIKEELLERGEQIREREQRFKQSFKEKEGKCMYYIGEICLLLLIELIAVGLMYILVRGLVRDLPVP